MPAFGKGVIDTVKLRGETCLKDQNGFVCSLKTELTYSFPVVIHWLLISCQQQTGSVILTKGKNMTLCFYEKSHFNYCMTSATSLTLILLYCFTGDPNEWFRKHIHAVFFQLKSLC